VTHGSLLLSRFPRYLLNTVLSFGVTVGGTWALHSAVGMSEELSYGISLVAAFFLNFFMFRHYVFEGKEVQPGRQLGAFGVLTIVFRCGEFIGFLAIHTYLGVHYILTVFLVQGTTFVIKYFVYGGIVFAGSTSSTSVTQGDRAAPR
jgi:putative flippase GtrA